MALQGRILTVAAAFLFLLGVFSVFQQPSYSLVNYLPISIFVIIWAIFAFGGSSYRAYHSQTQTVSGVIWAVSTSIGLSYALSLLYPVDPNILLIACGVTVILLTTTHRLIASGTRPSILGYLSTLPFFVVGSTQIVFLSLGLLGPSLGFNNAVAITAIFLVALTLLYFRFRKSEASRFPFWFISSLGIFEVSRSYSVFTYGLSYFVFSSICLIFILLAYQWQQSIRIRYSYLLCLLPLSVAGFIQLSSMLPSPQQAGLLTLFLVVFSSFLYIGNRSSSLLAIALGTGSGIVGYRLAVSYLFNFISWWLAYLLTLPFLAFLIYKCSFDYINLSSPTQPQRVTTAVKQQLPPKRYSTPIAKPSVKQPVIRPIAKPPPRRSIQHLVVQWPMIQEYSGAFQNLHLHMLDPELKRGSVELDNLGLPRSISGNFACVFKVFTRNNVYAVRCFYNSKIADLQKRYQTISNHLSSVKLPFFVKFTYEQQGIRIGGEEYPILKMAWAEGEVLNRFINKNLGNKNLLETCAKKFIECVAEMQKNKIAHGDLQHGNIKVSLNPKTSSINVYFVDYDGLYVPGLTGSLAPESGHSNYQHPERMDKHFNEKLDNFSALVIYMSILAVADNPNLWKRYNDDECIIFTKNDFKNPKQSKLFQELSKSNSEKVRKLTELLIESLNHDPLSDKMLPDQIAAI